MNSVTDFFKQYDAISESVKFDTHPNNFLGNALSNKDMYVAACVMLKVDKIDLFAPVDFGALYQNASQPDILSHCYIAFLRWNLWKTAILIDIGNVDFNLKASAYSEYWYLKLRDRFVAHHKGLATKHSWMN